ncbi:MAG TPA: pilus assembly protein CpaF [Actinobacteria bacterium]|nr:pilus assembly protein CpaF [Actinomycetota bacterium]
MAGGQSVTAASVEQQVRALQPVAPRGHLYDLTTQVLAELSGYSVLEPVMADPLVTDVVINGADSVWIDRGEGMVRTPFRFADDDHLRDVVVRWAASVGRRLDQAQPFVDAGLKDGHRLHAVLPPLAPRICVSLRLHRPQSFSLRDLEVAGSLGADGYQWLCALMAARCAFLITGGTGSGKTTVLSALLSEVPPTQRIVLVEDTPELFPQHPHVVSLVARHANAEGMGAIGLEVLIRQALRMRPDRLVVGEARGAELIDLLSALNTGHEGGCGTMHANSPADVVARIVALCSRGGWSAQTSLAQLTAAIDAVVHVVREPDGSRRLSSIGVVVGDLGKPAEVVTAVQWSSDGRAHLGPGGERLLARLSHGQGVL